MDFDSQYYTSSTPEEILAFYNKYCKVSNDDIPDEDEIPVYKPEPEEPSAGSEVIAEVKSNTEEAANDLSEDPDNEGLDVVEEVASEPKIEKKVESAPPAVKNDDVDADDLLDDLGI